MKKLVLTTILFLFVYASYAQTDTTQKQIGNVNSVKTDTTEGDIIICKYENEAEFPGGEQAWRNFLQRNLRYPSNAIKNKIQGTVILQFIVCQDGTVCDIQAISGPDELKEAAIDVMKKTPKWVPAFQNGRHVKAYKKQPIVYRIAK
jgi:periplasmic protein TonB